jgi:uncharacterized protein (PEP-CTERM system associated)
MTAAERGGRGRRDRALIVASALALGVGAAPVAAQYSTSAPFPTNAPLGTHTPLRITPTLSGELTYTNNVDLLPSDQREGDFVLLLTPGVSIEHESPRSVLRGSIALPTALYARTGSDNNEVSPLVNLYGRGEVIENFFFVEAQAYVQQTYLNPFGAQPDNLVNVTDNRYTSASYRVTPFIEGDIGGTVHYILRDDNLWTNLDNSPIGDRRVYTNHLTGSIDRVPAPFGWGADIDRAVHSFPEQERNQTLELARLRAVWRPDAQWQGYVSGGYERNKFPLTESDGAIYGLGFAWRPTDRTSLDVGWEHRFFGGSYRFLFDHRTPRTAWTVRASRNITSYPEQIANVPAGSFLPFVLNAILTSRIPDPAERVRFIQTYITDRGLPLVLTEPLAIYSQQIYLQELASASVGLLGVRNTIVFSIYRSKSEAIAGSGATLPPVLGGVNNTTQVGGSAVWSYQLTPTATLTVTGSLNTTEANEPFSAKSDERSIRIALTRPISPNTTAFAGARYQALDSDVANSYREAAVFAGFQHLFR